MATAWKKGLGIGLALTGICVAAVAVRKVKALQEAQRQDPDLNDPVDLYIEESFPASDPPSYTPTSSIGGKT